MSAADPHAGGRTVFAGESVRNAAAAVVMLHGRGGSADDLVPLFEAIAAPGVAAVLPEALAGTWYPHSFLAPPDANEPWLGSALRRVEAAVRGLLDAGLPVGRIAVLGFSQGACLASEFVARHPRPYGGLMALTGGRIGPAGVAWPDAGRLDGVPVLLASGDPDPHVPFGRVLETRDAFERAGAVMDVRRYPGRAHTISPDEVEACRAMVRAIGE